VGDERLLIHRSAIAYIPDDFSLPVMSSLLMTRNANGSKVREIERTRVFDENRPDGFSDATVHNP